MVIACCNATFSNVSIQQHNSPATERLELQNDENTDVLSKLKVSGWGRHILSPRPGWPTQLWAPLVQYSTALKHLYSTKKGNNSWLQSMLWYGMFISRCAIPLQDVMWWYFRMDTFYRVIFSVCVNWRTYSLIIDQNLLSIIGIDRETVSWKAFSLH